MNQWGLLSVSSSLDSSLDLRLQCFSSNTFFNRYFMKKSWMYHWCCSMKFSTMFWELTESLGSHRYVWSCVFSPTPTPLTLNGHSSRFHFNVFFCSQGHLLLIGVSGAGKTTLSRFVAWMNGLSVFQVKVIIAQCLVFKMHVTCELQAL